MPTATKLHGNDLSELIDGDIDEPSNVAAELEALAEICRRFAKERSAFVDVAPPGHAQYAPLALRHLLAELLEVAANRSNDFWCERVNWPLLAGIGKLADSALPLARDGVFFNLYWPHDLLFSDEFMYGLAIAENPPEEPQPRRMPLEPLAMLLGQKVSLEQIAKIAGWFMDNECKVADQSRVRRAIAGEEAWPNDVVLPPEQSLLPRKRPPTLPIIQQAAKLLAAE